MHLFHVSSAETLKKKKIKFFNESKWFCVRFPHPSKTIRLPRVKNNLHITEDDNIQLLLIFIETYIKEITGLYQKYFY